MPDFENSHNVGINLDDQYALYGKPGDDYRIMGQGGFFGEFARRFGDGTKIYDSKEEMNKVWQEMLDFAATRLFKLGFDGYIKPNAEALRNNQLIPEISITSRLDKRQQAVLDAAIDIERKIWDAQHMSSKDLKQQGYNTDLLQG